ncbi:MAG: hypothetical protein HUU50_05515 [Candidatus Brocadiae bacterium]|nr:hypothetical protein [Candidatus Brocadiia bacterium]
MLLKKEHYALVVVNTLLTLLFGLIFFSIPFVYAYRFWSSLRILFLLFVFPYTHKNLHIVSFFSLLLPFSIAVSLIESISFLRFLAVEFYIVALHLGISLLPLKEKKFLEKYIPLAFFFATFPIFLWYLYVDIIQLSLDWLFFLSPLGLAFFL